MHNTNLAVVAPGIAEALFATAIGLVAAIPAVLAYNKISNDLARFASPAGRLRHRVQRHPVAPERGAGVMTAAARLAAAEMTTACLDDLPA